MIRMTDQVIGMFDKPEQATASAIEDFEATIRAAFADITSMALPEGEPHEGYATCHLCRREGSDTHHVSIEWRGDAYAHGTYDVCHDCIMAWHYDEWTWLDA